MIQALSLQPRHAALLVLLGSAAVLAGAFISQYGFSLEPCVLCIYQRWPHAAAIVLALLAYALRRRHGPAAGLLLLAGLSLWVGVAIAGYHVGVEQHWWTGTEECVGGASTAGLTVEQLRQQLMNTSVVRCDEVQWSLFGVSLAGYNFILSLATGLLAFLGARSAYRGGAR